MMDGALARELKLWLEYAGKENALDAVLRVHRRNGDAESTVALLVAVLDPGSIARRHPSLDGRTGALFLQSLRGIATDDEALLFAREMMRGETIWLTVIASAETAELVEALIERARRVAGRRTVSPAVAFLLCAGCNVNLSTGHNSDAWCARDAARWLRTDAGRVSPPELLAALATRFSVDGTFTDAAVLADKLAMCASDDG